MSSIDNKRVSYILGYMRNYRFTILAEDRIIPERELISVMNKATIHQVRNVLRLENGALEEISFIDGSGWVYFCSLKSINKDNLEFQIRSKSLSQREPKKQVKFLIPIIKPEAFNLMVQKLTEIGVYELQPIFYQRSQEPYLKSFIKHQEKIRTIIQEATEQSQGARFTLLHDCKKLSELDNFDAQALKLFGYEALAGSETNSILQKTNFNQIILAVGPEGGLTDQEAKFFYQHDFQACSLGKRLLKAETAAISLVSKLDLE